MAQVEVVEQVTVKRTACDSCGKIIYKDEPPYDLHWYHLEHVGFTGHDEMWFCSIPCVLKWTDAMREAGR